MIVDGRGIAEEIYAELRARVGALSRAPRFTIITCAPNFETKKYLALKMKKAKEIGIEVKLIDLKESSATEDVIEEGQRALPESDGLIVQMPMPEAVDMARIVRTIPPSHDVDALNMHTVDVLSPVVASFKEILVRYGIDAAGKHVAILGSGKLVGIPAYQWFTAKGASVSVVTKDTEDIPYYTRTADIVVCGAGVPGLLTVEMIREGAIVLDAGTSEDGGELKGDADPRCAEKASLFTPVPGGIGPLTIAMLLSNVVKCASRKLT